MQYTNQKVTKQYPPINQIQDNITIHTHNNHSNKSNTQLTNQQQNKQHKGKTTNHTTQITQTNQRGVPTHNGKNKIVYIHTHTIYTYRHNSTTKTDANT